MGESYSYYIEGNKDTNKKKILGKKQGNDHHKIHENGYLS